jgi:cell division protein FtsL
MNTAVKTIKISSQMQHALHWADVFPIISLPGLRVALLLFATLISALSIVYVKDLNRRFFIQHQILENVHDQIQVDWGKLLLEQGAWSTQSRIQELAGSTLEMRVPSAQEIVLVKYEQDSDSLHLRHPTTNVGQVLSLKARNLKPGLLKTK